jgi:hypothetical protein
MARCQDHEGRLTYRDGGCSGGGREAASWGDRRCVMRLLRALYELMFGKRCERHDVYYRSDFCPRCNRAMWVRFETREIV